MTPRYLFGQLRCRSCRDSWLSTWSTAVPYIVCHVCGYENVVPVGVQVPVMQSPAGEGHMWAIERQQVRRTQS